MSTTAATTTATSFTFADLERMIDVLQETEPFRKLMIERGCNPADGWVLFLPKRYEADLGANVPDYVKYSTLLSRAVLCHGARFEARPV